MDQYALASNVKSLHALTLIASAPTGVAPWSNGSTTT